MIASLIVGGAGYGILGNIAVSIAGSFLGAFIFSRAGWHAPMAGLGGTILISTILLVVLHLLTSASAHA